MSINRRNQSVSMRLNQFHGPSPPCANSIKFQIAQVGDEVANTPLWMDPNHSRVSSRLCSQHTSLIKLQIPPTDDEATETSSIQLSLIELSPISPILSSQYSFLNGIEAAPTTNMAPAPSHHLRFASSRGHSSQKTTDVTVPDDKIRANILRRSASERKPHRRDSGIAFNDENGLHNAKMAVKAMNRAMNPSARSCPPVPKKANSQLDLNTDRQRLNSAKAGLRRNSFRRSNSGAGGQCGFCSRRGVELFPRVIEEEEILTQKKILDGHIQKIFNTVSPKISEGAQREVEVVASPAKTHNGLFKRFGDTNAEDEMEEQQKKSLWKRMVQKVKSRCI